ncbi:Zn-dependent hydrolase [Agrobacterium sp. 22-221-1]
MKRLSNIRPDMSRLWATLMRSAEIGATEKGGLKRLALSDEDAAMRHQFIHWCEEAGLTVRIDAVGNIFAERAGTDADAKPVLVGSHLDTQVHGGRFDGILGVLAGLELVRTLNDHAIATRRPITLVNWTNEEGARFEPPMIGSAVFTGAKAAEFAYSRRDRDGFTLGGELERIGFKGKYAISAEAFDSLFELHIEQGPRLEAAAKQLGIVTGAFGVRGFVVEVHGETGHVGPTPMPARKNALVGAAEVTLAINEIGWANHETGGKSTTMRIRAEPNLLGALPNFVEMTCDMRHPDDAVVSTMFEAFKARLPELEERSRCKIVVKEGWAYGGMHFDAGCIELIRNATGAFGYSSMDLLTEAGHDAMHVAEYLPTAMIFTPCEGGLSHNEAENVTIADIEPGVNVLVQAVLERANRAD